MPRTPARKKTRLGAARERMYRELIFESAEHVFAQKGFDEATMQDVAAEAGVSLKTLYATYPGKNELYGAIGGVRGAEFTRRVAEAHERPGSAVERLEAGVRAYVDFLVEHPDFLRIHLREGKAWALEPQGAARESWAQGVEGLVRIVEQGIEEGLFHPGDPELMAMTGVAVMQVQLARYAEGIGEEDAGRVADDTILQLRRLYCKPEHMGRAAA